MLTQGQNESDKPSQSDPHPYLTLKGSTRIRDLQCHLSIDAILTARPFCALKVLILLASSTMTFDT